MNDQDLTTRQWMDKPRDAKSWDYSGYSDIHKKIKNNIKKRYSDPSSRHLWDELDNHLDEGHTNANDTARENSPFSQRQWDNTLKDTISMHLAENDHSPKAAAFWKKHGIEP